MALPGKMDRGQLLHDCREHQEEASHADFEALLHSTVLDTLADLCVACVESVLQVGGIACMTQQPTTEHDWLFRQLVRVCSSKSQVPIAGMIFLQLWSSTTSAP